MKVFTVGLDQKPPPEDGKEKSGSPPPGYSTTEARIPLPLGPELGRPPLPPQPIIVRKSRGYKGILLVMLAVFLMAVFALVLSEMAYNRQREENFFKLRWAELKHRMGYESEAPYDYYQRAAASVGDKFDRLMALAKSNEPQALSAEQESATTSSSPPPPPTPEPIVAIDSFPMAPADSGSASSSRQSSIEIEPPQPQLLFGNSMNNGPLSQLRDARLQFLRNILQKIKQHAEDIGFDGTMQVSIIEVEPQNGADGESSAPSGVESNNWAQRPLVQQMQQFPQLPAHFFPHPRPLVSDDFKNSRSFLDGFGEFHQPNFMQNNQVVEQEERPRIFGPWMQQQQNEFPPQTNQQNGPPDFAENMRWPRVNPFRQPEMMFFHPIFPQQMNLRFPPPPPPSTSEWAQAPQQSAAIPRPSSFDRWNGQNQFPQHMIGINQMQQEQQQPVQPPQHQQIQIDFPEVKLPPPIISDNTEDKFPVAPPQQQQQPQPPKEAPIWLPKWLGEGIDNQQQQQKQQQQPQEQQQEAGPPSVQPSDIVKFPSVTVVEPAKNMADNEEGNGPAVVVESEKKEPTQQQQTQPAEEVVEVEAPQPNPEKVDQVEQKQPEQQGEGQQQPKEQQEQTAQQPMVQQQPFQKWFPEVPSVFFQVDDPNGNSDEASNSNKPDSAQPEQQRPQQLPQQQQQQSAPQMTE